MGMTIEEAQTALGKERKYALHENKQAFDIAIDTMRKYQQLQADYEARFKTGKWIVHRKSDGEVGYFQCSSCNHHSVVKFPYCPICGAEMDCNPNILSEMKAIPRDMYETRLKADMVAMLTDIQLRMENLRFGQPPRKHVVDECLDVIQQKIDALKMN